MLYKIMILITFFKLGLEVKNWFQMLKSLAFEDSREMNRLRNIYTIAREWGEEYFHQEMGN